MFDSRIIFHCALAHNDSGFFLYWFYLPAQWNIYMNKPSIFMRTNKFRMLHCALKRWKRWRPELISGDGNSQDVASKETSIADSLLFLLCLVVIRARKKANNHLEKGKGGGACNGHRQTRYFLLLSSSCHDPYTNRHLKQIEGRGESGRKDVIEHHFLMRFAHSFQSISVRF